MSIYTKRFLFALAWLFIVLSGPHTALKHSAGLEIGMNPYFINFIQRLTGLLGFSLLFIQIITGAYMKRIVQIIGSKAFILHIIQGLGIVAVIIIHPLMYYLLGYETSQLSNYLIVDLSNPFGYFVLLGQLAFLLIATTVIVGYFRTKPIFRRIWRKIHVLNYIAIFIVGIHSWGIGTDVRYTPFSIVYMLSIPTIAIILLHKIYLYFKENDLKLLDKIMLISKYER